MLLLLNWLRRAPCHFMLLETYLKCVSDIHLAVSYNYIKISWCISICLYICLGVTFLPVSIGSPVSYYKLLEKMRDPQVGGCALGKINKIKFWT